MPHPQEQKLHEVVTSVTLASLTSFVAARTAVTSITPSSASPTEPPAASCSQRRRLTMALSRLPPQVFGSSGSVAIP